MKENQRKCIKCGCSPARDPTVTLHRFPRPGRTNILRCELWAKYCFPNCSWSSSEFQAKLFSQHLMLCSKHFRSTSFMDKKLFKSAVPDEEEYDKEVESGIRNRNETGLVEEQVPENDSQSDKRQTEHEHIEPENEDFSWEGHSEPEFIQEELESKVPEKTIFSWEGRKEPDLIHEDEAEHTDDVPGDLSMYCDDEGVPKTTKQLDRTGRHEGFHCDHCNGDIVGYRYTCVQCSDLDLCATCESRGAHSHHYMLRVPEPRPYNEIQTVLARIRMHLMKQLDPISGPDVDNDDVVSVKSEVKSEDEAEEAEDPEQINTLAEHTVTSEAEEHSRLSSPASPENSGSTVVLDEVVQEPDTTLKGKVQNLLRVSLPDKLESTLSNTAKRKHLEEVSGPVETLGSNQLAKRICYRPSKKLKLSIVRDSKAVPEGSRVTFVKLPPGALLKHGDTVSLQIRPPKDPLTNATDSKS